MPPQNGSFLMIASRIMGIVKKRRWLRGAVVLLALTHVAGCTHSDTITLGATLQLTGSLANTGRYYRDGYQIAVDRINEKGGIAIGDIHYKLALKILDNELTPISARGSRWIWSPGIV